MSQHLCKDCINNGSKQKARPKGTLESKIHMAMFLPVHIPFIEDDSFFYLFFLRQLLLYTLETGKIRLYQCLLTSFVIFIPVNFFFQRISICDYRIKNKTCKKHIQVGGLATYVMPHTPC